MGILVIEGGSPNGTDLVVGEHLRNRVAQANAAAQRAVPVMDIGGGYGVLGISIEPAIRVDEAGEKQFCAVVYVVGGRQSDLVPMIPVKLPMGELAAVPVAKLRELLEGAMPKDPQ